MNKINRLLVAAILASCPGLAAAAAPKSGSPAPAPAPRPAGIPASLAYELVPQVSAARSLVEGLRHLRWGHESLRQWALVKATLGQRVMDHGAAWRAIGPLAMERAKLLAAGLEVGGPNQDAARLEAEYMTRFLDSYFGMEMSEAEGKILAGLQNEARLLRYKATQAKAEALAAALAEKTRIEEQAAVETAAVKAAKARDERVAKLGVYRNWLSNAKAEAQTDVLYSMQQLATEDPNDEAMQKIVFADLAKRLEGHDYERQAKVAKIMGEMAALSKVEKIKLDAVSLLMDKAAYAKSRYFAGAAGDAVGAIVVNYEPSAKVLASAASYFGREVRVFPDKKERRAAQEHLDDAIKMARDRKLALEIPEDGGLHTDLSPRAWGRLKTAWKMVRSFVEDSDGIAPIILGMLIPLALGVFSAETGFMSWPVALAGGLLMAAAVVRGVWHKRLGWGFVNGLLSAGLFAAVAPFVRPGLDIPTLAALGLTAWAQSRLARVTFNYGVPGLGALFNLFVIGGGLMLLLIFRWAAAAVGVPAI